MLLDITDASLHVCYILVIFSEIEDGHSFPSVPENEVKVLFDR